jgi:D-glycero-alpha-D-manno-heptose-7-phosphate kinase
MIITRTPYRISFFGGGTDYPAWYQEYGGAVLATSINKYCYISCRLLPPFFEHKHRIVYSIIESVSVIEEIKHPSVRAVLQWKNIEKGLEIHHDGDLPARSGLGSSSSFTVGLLQAMYALDGCMQSKNDLAKTAIHIEQNLIQENVGSQDQVSASFGGLNKIQFFQDDSFNVRPVIVVQSRKRELEEHLMLFFTGVTRIASDIAETQINNIKDRKSELFRMREMVDEAVSILENEKEPIDEFGKLLHENWKYKQSLSERITTPEINQIYDEALSAGAIGGKILGAGGGGFIMFFAKPENHELIKKRLSKLVYVPFEFEESGSQVVLYQPNGFK